MHEPLVERDLSISSATSATALLIERLATFFLLPYFIFLFAIPFSRRFLWRRRRASSATLAEALALGVGAGGSADSRRTLWRKHARLKGTAGWERGVRAWKGIGTGFSQDGSWLGRCLMYGKGDAMRAAARTETP